MKNEAKVPAGLKKCQKCGHYKGKCLQDGEPWTISCCCNLQVCRRCNEPVYKYRILSNIYSENNGRCWHVPVYAAWGHKCPDGVKGQLKNSYLIDLRTGKDLLNLIKK